MAVHWFQYCRSVAQLIVFKCRWMVSRLFDSHAPFFGTPDSNHLYPWMYPRYKKHTELPRL